MMLIAAGLAVVGSFEACSGCKEPKVLCEQEGYEPAGDSCACPPGKFEAYGICRALKPNELYGAADGCGCLEGIFFLVYGRSASRLFIQTIGKEGHELDASLDYTETAEGDSLSGVWPGLCYIEGRGYSKKVTGMYYNNGTARLKFRFVRYEPDTEVEIVKDSCTVTLTGN